MKIAVIGTGYVGLVTGTCLADAGHMVTCIDIDANKVAQLSQGICPIFEPDLDGMIVRNLQEKRLDFSTSLEAGIS